MTRHPARRASTVLRTAAALAAAALLLAGCSGSGSDSGASTGYSAADSAAGGDGTSGAAPEAGKADGSALADDGSALSRDAAAAPQVSPVDLSSEQLARRASMALKVKSIAAAAAKVRSIAATSEGLILSENIGGSAEQSSVEEDRVTATTYGEIAISVPSARLDDTLDELARLGTLIRRDASTENVSQQVIDTDARLRTLQASVDRIRALMSQTQDITQIVRLETELSSRTADLESLKSQLTSLKNSVARSPIQVSLTTDTGVIKEDAGTGFLAGLAAGWSAFTGSVVVLLTVLGALLPFLMVLALVLVPVWMVLRRRRNSAPQPFLPQPPVGPPTSEVPAA